MPYPAGHRAEVEGKAIQSAREIQSVWLRQCLSEADPGRRGSHALPRPWGACSPIRNARVPREGVAATSST